jgi:hypothetical protein
MVKPGREHSSLTSARLAIESRQLSKVSPGSHFVEYLKHTMNVGEAKFVKVGIRKVEGSIEFSNDRLYSPYILLCCDSKGKIRNALTKKW